MRPDRIRRLLGKLPGIRPGLRHVQQMSVNECGAACLATVLDHFGRPTSVTEIRQVCPSGRDGASAREIVTAAENFGLEARAFSADTEHLEELPTPAVLHWGFQHFVVLESWDGDGATIVDPALGRRKIDREEVDRKFTGIVLTFRPTPELETGREHSPTSAWAYVKRFLPGLDVGRTVVQILLASLLLQVAGLVLPGLTKVVVDVVLPRSAMGLLQIVGVGLLLIVAVQVTVSYLRSLLMVRLRTRLDRSMMEGFFTHLLRLPFSFFQQRASGDLLMRLSSNATIRDILTNQTLSVLLDGSLVVGYWLIIATQSTVFGVVAGGLAVLQVAILVGTYRRVHELNQQGLSARADEQGYLVEILKGVESLKAAGAEDAALDRWSGLFLRNLNVSVRRNYLSAKIDTALSGLRTLSPLLLLWVGATQVMAGEMALGTMLALSSLANAFLSPLGQLVNSGQQFQLLRANLERLADVVDADPEEETDRRSGDGTDLQGGVALRDVSFRYASGSPLVLEEIDLEIDVGETVALVGPTGSGKSTLTLLLLGLHRPETGEVLFDGRPLAELSLRSLRSQVGLVLQDPSLFSGSIRENIAIARPDVGLDRVVAAARLAAIHEEIAAMPMGYETKVAEGGGAVSGGQRQRIAIARAVVGEPKILVLDEATSHLDARTERRVHANLARLDCTRIVIAHRLSTVREADRIYVLRGGRITESGTHDDLLDRRGDYATLLGAQLEEGSRGAARRERRKEAVGRGR